MQTKVPHSEGPEGLYLSEKYVRQQQQFSKNELYAIILDKMFSLESYWIIVLQKTKKQKVIYRPEIEMVYLISLCSWVDLLNRKKKFE